MEIKRRKERKEKWLALKKNIREKLAKENKTFLFIKHMQKSSLEAESKFHSFRTGSIPPPLRHPKKS